MEKQVYCLSSSFFISSFLLTFHLYSVAGILIVVESNKALCGFVEHQMNHKRHTDITLKIKEI